MTTRTGITPIELTDTFQIWLEKTNEAVDVLNENAILASSSGFSTIGDATLEGTFTADAVSSTEVSTDNISVNTIVNRDDEDSVIAVNSPMKIQSPSNLENMLEIQTNAGEKPIVGMINGAGGRWNLSLETANVGSAFNISTPGASTPQLRVLQNGKVIAPQFEGIGTNLTNLNAANVTTGILSSDVMPFLIEKFITFRRAGGTRFDRALDQDGVLIRGRDGGTSGYSVTVTPGVLTGNRTLTLANGDTVLSPGTMVATSRSITTPVGSGLSGGGDLSANRTLSLTGQALAFHGLADNGIVVRRASGVIEARVIESSNDEQITVTNGNGVADAPIQIGLVTASNAEAVAGINATKAMTPVRVKEAIAALSPKWNYSAPIPTTGIFAEFTNAGIASAREIEIHFILHTSTVGISQSGGWPTITLKRSTDTAGNALVTGYSSSSFIAGNSTGLIDNGFVFYKDTSTRVVSGTMRIVKAASNKWVQSHSLSVSPVAAAGGGSLVTSETITGIRLFSTNGSGSGTGGEFVVAWR